MTSSEFESIKRKINQNQEKLLKSKGVCEQIQKDWKKNYGFETVEEAENKLEELKQEKNNKIERKRKLMDKLEGMYDWEKV